RRNADIDVIRPHVLRRDGHRPDHSLFVHMNAREHCGVIRNSNSVIDSRHRVRYVLLLHDTVRVTVNVRVVADRHVVAQHDATAVIEEYIAVDDDVIADFHVVAERELDVVKRLEVLSTSLEDVPSEYPPELDTEPHVLCSRGRAVEGIPEPEQRLDALE